MTGLQQQLTEQIIVAARIRQAPAPQAEARDYDFTRPWCFTSTQLARLEEFTARFAKLACQGLGHELHGPVELVGLRPCQCFLRTLREQASSGRFLVPLTLHPGNCLGVLALDAGQIRSWLGALLGGAAPSADQPLSQLESSLVFDLVSVLLDGFNASARSSGLSLEFREQLLENCNEVPGDDTQELLGIQLSAKAAPDTPVLCAYMPAEHAGALAGLQAQKKLSSDQTRQLLLGRVLGGNVQVEVRLGQVSLSGSALLGLAAGDVVLLDGKADQPAQVILGGKCRFLASPAASRGRYAVQIMSSVQADQKTD